MMIRCICDIVLVYSGKCIYICIYVCVCVHVQSRLYMMMCDLFMYYTYLIASYLPILTYLGVGVGVGIRW